MISMVDAERIKDIGLNSAKIKVLGNAKYDGLASMVSPVLQNEIALRFNVRENENFLLPAAPMKVRKKLSLVFIRIL